MEEEAVNWIYIQFTLVPIWTSTEGLLSHILTALSLSPCGLFPQVPLWKGYRPAAPSATTVQQLLRPPLQARACSASLKGP
jgi:hypothetical protein